METPVKQLVVLSYVDSVATSLAPLARGDVVSVTGAADGLSIEVLENIPFGHKVALRDIADGEAIVKYGEVIGRALVAIPRGNHVHVHNVEGLRARGDRPDLWKGNQG